MNVYPTRRTRCRAAALFDATKRIATTAQLAAGGNGVVGAVEGIPFPVPTEGVEPFWNHVLRYRADGARERPGRGDLAAASYNDGEVLARGRGVVRVARSPAAKGKRISTT